MRTNSGLAPKFGYVALLVVIVAGWTATAGWGAHSPGGARWDGAAPKRATWDGTARRIGATPRDGRAPNRARLSTRHLQGRAPTSVYSAASTDLGSMYNTTLITGAREYWKAGYTGKGIDIALIDSGVSPVDGLKNSGTGTKLINGVDVSFESQSSNLRYLDTFGHGTHMAGIMAGRGDAAGTPYQKNTTAFVGMAPDARVISVKAADAHGATDVSQIIAAIDWVVQHKNDNGMNIRVINLSYGTDSGQDYLVDPLCHAVEQAWKAGIVVVVAAGNAGYARGGTMTNPAIDPFIVAVGASDHMGTVGTADDRVAAFSSNAIIGNGTRLVDVVAPGRSIVGLRVPNSYADANYAATGAVTPGLFRGSGTSQAAAVVSGAAALILQRHPTLTPAQVKRVLRDTATRLPNDPSTTQGAGEINLAAALRYTPTSAPQNYVESTGTGTLEASRGTNHLVKDGVALVGEQDIFGQPFDAAAMAQLEATRSSWSGGDWNRSTWSGSTWSSSSWSTTTWLRSSWSGSTWSSSTWSASTWSGSTWSASSWSANNWLGGDWSSNAWSHSSWS